MRVVPAMIIVNYVSWLCHDYYCIDSSTVPRPKKGRDYVDWSMCHNQKVKITYGLACIVSHDPWTCCDYLWRRMSHQPCVVITWWIVSRVKFYQKMTFKSNQILTHFCFSWEKVFEYKLTGLRIGRDGNDKIPSVEMTETRIDFSEIINRGTRVWGK